VPRIERSAVVTWDGNLARGTGLISGDTGAFSRLPFSLPTRIGQAEGKTSPEELLAAAHAGCLAMSLAGELTSGGTPPGRLEVHARVHIDEVEGRGHLVRGSAVTIRGRVSGLGRDAWETAVEAAHRGCTFSTLLRDAGAEVTIESELEEA
jgi:osmotically inducible protein OsmC